MRRAAIIATTVALSACVWVPSGIFTRVQVKCGATELVYSNSSRKLKQNVTVKATDLCAGKDSELQLLDADGKVLQRFPIPDGTTKTIQVDVPDGHWLNFVCAGNASNQSSGCSYSVITE